MQKVNEGDIFITRLERGFFGAFRILKTKCKLSFSDNDFYLIAITNYIGLRRPMLNYQSLLDVLQEKRFLHEKRLVINYYYSELDLREHFEYLGNIPLSRDEKSSYIDPLESGKIKYPYMGEITKDFGFEAFLEWRWRNEADLIQEEIEKSKERAKEVLQRNEMDPQGFMEELEFWKIISQLDWSKTDDADVVKAVIELLSHQRITIIKQFEDTFMYKMYCLDTKEHAESIGYRSFKSFKDFDVENFENARALVLCKGKTLYYEALENPERMPKDMVFKHWKNIARNAFTKKTGRHFDFKSQYSCETYSNKKGWLNEDFLDD